MNFLLFTIETEGGGGGGKILWCMVSKDLMLILERCSAWLVAVRNAETDYHLEQ